MNYKDIIKAVGCCGTKGCYDCPYKIYTNCKEEVIRGACNLITHQNAKIERLKKYDEERDIRLHARLTETARAEAIKEFAERYKAEIKKEYECIPYHDLYVEAINRLVKEMTRGIE